MVSLHTYTGVLILPVQETLPPFMSFTLPKTQAGIKIAGRNINNLRYADDITLMAESEFSQFSHSVVSDSL